MAKKTDNAISPTRAEDYPEWYQQVVKAADLAEPSPVRGCMVIKPWGFSIWENVQRTLDKMFKDTGHVNAYFPLFIPLSFLEKEAEHVEGFAKECAVVTHHRLKKNPDGPGLIPDGELEEPLVVRPTSETIIGATYAKWVQSYRDLPILINQWANVVRWEMRPRVFLRTAEFLWQEGHTVHATAEEAMVETLKMLDVYADFAENWLAMPVIKGEKTPDERFPGAVNTYAIEAMMQDRKALQAGTSHFLGQNFAKASEIKFLDHNNKEAHAWTTSWGVSTRLIGALIMTHSDDDGLIVPPKLAPKHAVVLPIWRTDEDRARVLEYCDKLAGEMRSKSFSGGGVQVDIDARDLRGGEKVWQHIKRGVPLRVEVGPRDMDADAVFVARRDKPAKEKVSVPRAQFVAEIGGTLDEIQTNLFERAKSLREANSHRIDKWSDFESLFAGDDEKGGPTGGFAHCHWSDDPAAADAIAAKLAPFKVSARCIPIDCPDEPGACLFTGKPSRKRVVFARAY